jgi:mannitol-1-phosphate 5-dehydrogenase
VKEAMKESGEVLINRYGFEREKHYQYIDKILNRFKNPYLKDEVSRVGREPLRKLSFNDRLIKPLRGTIEYNTKNDNLIKGIAAALKYRNPADEQAIKLEERLNSDDLKTAVEDITSLSNKAVIEKIIDAYKA